MKEVSMAIALKIEYQKLKRKHVGLILLFTILVQSLWLWWAMGRGDFDKLEIGYMTCLYQFPQLNALLFPIVIGVMVSILCDIEHKGSTFKQLFTMQNSKQVFDAKFIVAIAHLLLGILLQISLIFVIGKLLNFGDVFPLNDYLLYFISQSTTSIFIIIIIQTFALLFSNQFIPLIIGLIAGFAGFTSAFLPVWLMRLIPSSYYMLLTTVSLEWNETTKVASFYMKDFGISDCIRLILVIVVFLFVSRRLFSKKEV